MHLARFLVIYTGPESGPEKIIILARLLIYRTFVYRGLIVLGLIWKLTFVVGSTMQDGAFTILGQE